MSGRVEADAGGLTAGERIRGEGSSSGLCQELVKGKLAKIEWGNSSAGLCGRVRKPSVRHRHNTHMCACVCLRGEVCESAYTILVFRSTLTCSTQTPDPSSGAQTPDRKGYIQPRKIRSEFSH